MATVQDALDSSMAHLAVPDRSPTQSAINSAQRLAYWQKIPRWALVSEHQFLSYRWQVRLVKLFQWRLLT